jgi:hypothetical protein
MTATTCRKSKAKLELPEFIREATQWIIDAVGGKEDNPTENYAQIGSSGNSAQIGSSGYYAQIGSSGNYARIVCEGDNAVVASAGRDTVVAGVDGTWVSLAEHDGRGKCIGFATGCIGKDGLKAGVPYRALGGKLVEAK